MTFEGLTWAAGDGLAGEEPRMVTKEEGGGPFFTSGLEAGNDLATTGRFFFPEGSFSEISAGRLIPAKPPTACTHT